MGKQRLDRPAVLRRLRQSPLPRGRAGVGRRGSFSFVGGLFEDARVAFVRIGQAMPSGADDNTRRDVVMMDDFIYGEPQRVVGTH